MMGREWKMGGIVRFILCLLLAGCWPDVDPDTKPTPSGDQGPVQPGPPPEVTPPDEPTQPPPEEEEPPPEEEEPPPEEEEPPPEEEEPPPEEEEPQPPPLIGLPPPPAHFTYPPLQTTLEEYRVEIDPLLFQLFYENRDTPLQPAIFTTPDGQRREVQMRLRGNSSRGWPKKSWRIEFPEGTQFDGRRKLNLISEWRDSTMMLEKLGFDMLEAMGVPAPRGKYVRLVINGVYQGVYLDLERIDKNFMRNHGYIDSDGSIWRCGGKNCEMKTYYEPAYQRTWEKETNEMQPDTALEEFLRAVNYTPEPQLVEVLQEKFELEHHLRTIAMDALISNATVEDSRSYVVHDAVTGRFSYVTWDLNNTDAKYVPGKRKTNADFEHPLFNFSLFDSRVKEEYLDRASGEPGRWKPIFSNLNTRIVLHPELREQVLAHVEQALEELFSPEIIDARIDAMYKLLDPHMRGTPHIDEPLFHDGPRYMKRYARERAQFLRDEVSRWRKWKPTLALQAVNAREGWLELRNLGTQPVSTAGLVLTTELRSVMTPNVPARILQPGETMRLTAAGLGLQLAPKGEVGLFDGLSVVGVLDALFYGELPAGKYYARSTAQPLHWEVR